jgi:DNA mismatch endonuclease, patch repair protein
MAEGPAKSVSRTPPPSSETVSRNMRALRARDTGPELALRRELHARGLRYRVHRRPDPEVRSVADVVFVGARVAVYVDGCFWHGCPEHAVMPKRNREFWSEKLRGNMLRDRRTDEELGRRGWTVLRIWEHEDPRHAADLIMRQLHRLDQGRGP